MRRSDMVDKLQKVLEEFQDCEATLDVADNVLLELEVAGMLPPPFKDGDATTYHLWEPEEECEIPEYTLKCPNCTCEEKP